MALTEQDPGFGSQLRWWRRYRRLSQLELASVAEVSAKHLSFLETGRSSPSREMILHLAAQLDVPVREQNALLRAAGYSPRFEERPLDDARMADVRRVVDLHLTHHEPYPAVCVDRRWDLLAANTAAAVFLDGVDPELLGPPINVVRVSLHPEGLAPRVLNFAEYASHLVARLRNQAALTADREITALVDEVVAFPGVADAPMLLDHTEAVLPLRLRAGDAELAFISTIATIGAPLDITTSEIAIEAFYPADDATVAHFEGAAS